MVKSHKENCASYENRISVLKNEALEYQRAIHEYKSELYYLKDFDTRKDKVAELRRNVMDTQGFLNEQEIEMTNQRKAILPVLNMINVSA